MGGVRRSTRRENDMMTQAATPEGMTTEETAVAGRVLPTVAAIAVQQELDVIVKAIHEATSARIILDNTGDNTSTG